MTTAASGLRVEMRGIEKRFGTAEALKGVDIDLLPGEIHAILGENGAGKSTLMHILAGSLRADRGSIRLGDGVVHIGSPRAARRLGIAMVHQHFALVPAFTVAENLALDSHATRTGRTRLLGLRPYNARFESAAALERARSLGWTLDPDAPIRDLAVGAQQRVEVVKALSTGARVLIFDEPTAVLAGSEVEELFQVLRQLKSEGCTVVLIAHKLAEILAVADRVTVLRHGERVASIERIGADAHTLARLMMGVDPGAAIPEEPKPRPEVQTSGQAGSSTLHSWQTDVPMPSSGPTGNAPMTPDARPALEAQDLVIIGDRGEVSIRGASLFVRPREILGIGGVDGNGQTQLAEALVGLRELKSGSIRWMGGDFQPGATPTTGYIPQDRRRSGLAVTMSVQENLLLEALRDRRYSLGPFLKSNTLRSIALDLVTRFDIRTSGLEAPVSSLSGGNQQKIVVARALWSEPDWIVAVNPTRGLDIGAARFVHEQLRMARARGAAILLISADFDEIAALSDRASVLSSGSLTEMALDGARADEIGLLLGGVRMDTHTSGGSTGAGI